MATKCIKRSGDDVKKEIAESFERLDLDVIDLMQLHAIDQDDDLGEVLAADGALRVIEEYRQSGKIRFVGLTGHTNPENFVRAMGEYDFDTLLNPMGVVNRVWNDFSQVTLPAARQKDMGVIGMKVTAGGQVPAEDLADFLRYSMSLPIDVAVVGMDTVEQVEENVRVAETFSPLSAQEEERILARGLELVPQVQKELWWLPEQRLAS